MYAKQTQNPELILKFEKHKKKQIEQKNNFFTA